MSSQYFSGKFVGKLIGATLLSLVINSTGAANTLTTKNELLIAPPCFLHNNNNIKHHQLATSNNFLLLAVKQDYFLNQLPKIKHTKDCGKFINVSDDWQRYLDKNELSMQETSAADYQIFLNHYIADIENQTKNKAPSASLLSGKNDELIKTLIEKVNNGRAWASLRALTNFYNRGAQTDDGVRAAAKIKTWITDLATQNNKTDKQFSVQYIYNKSTMYKQPSVVAVLGKDLPGSAIVIGAHMDTLGNGRMPGADDDGSGTIAVLEAARVIMESKHEFTRPIYFIWYSAEEVGLVGSKSVVTALKDKIKFDSVLHLDMVGYKPPRSDDSMWFLNDNVDMDFTNYLTDLAKTYLNVNTKFTSCGYACSDHANWTNAGISAAAGFESSFDDMSPYIHTQNDDLSRIDINWLTRFSKLAVAFIADKAG